MVKFVSYYIEFLAGYIVAIAITICAYFFVDFSKIHFSDLFYDKLVDFTGIVFGFLITVLTILLQSNNESIKLLKKYNRFKDLIFYNKEVVVFSALICFYTILIIALKDNFNFGNPLTLKKYGLLFLLFLITLMICKIYTFLKIFYTIIKEKE